MNKITAKAALETILNTNQLKNGDIIVCDYSGNDFFCIVCNDSQKPFLLNMATGRSFMNLQAFEWHFNEASENVMYRYPEGSQITITV